MASPLQRRLKNRDDGLGRIAGQLVRVKRRLNLLAAQQMAFSVLGSIIGAGGLLVIAAFFLSTAHFLVLGLILAVALAVGLPLAVVRALKRFAAFERAATIADQRAELNCRLGTLLTTEQEEGKSPLWPFLVEDTVSRLDEFKPDRIEHHRISRTIYGFAAACLIASLAGLMTYSARRHQEALRKVLKSLTLEVDPSEIAPSDNPSGESAQIEGDPDTLRSLAERLEAANENNRGAGHDPFKQLSQKAQNLASSLQDRLTGRDLRDTPEKVKLRLAQALGDKPPSPPPDDGASGEDIARTPQHKSGQSGGSADSGASRHQASPSTQEQANNDSAASAPDSGKQPPDSPSAKSFEPGGPEGPGTGDTPAPGSQQGSSEEASGQSAGGGSDPEHLMGPPDAPSHKNENFEIMIDARLSDRSPIASAQPYVPPKVKTSLNTYQHPDEPLDRGTVPAADREAIRRVFER
jgi:hypothetical protein